MKRKAPALCGLRLLVPSWVIYAGPATRTWSLVRPSQKQASACPGRKKIRWNETERFVSNGFLLRAHTISPLRLAFVRKLMSVLEPLRKPGIVPFIVRLVVAPAVSRRSALRPPAKAPGSPARLPIADAPDRAPAPHRPVRSAGRSRLAAQPPPSRSSGPYAPAARPGAPPPASSPDHTGSLPSVQPAVRIQMPLIPTPDRQARRPAASPLNGLCRQAHSPAGKPCAPARRPAPRLARHPSEAARPKATDRPAGPA